MSLLMGLIGGAGKGASELADQWGKERADKEMEKQRSDSAMAREQTLMRLKADLETESIGTRAEATANAALSTAPKMAEAGSIIDGAKQKTALIGKEAEANSPILRQAKVEDATATTEASTRAQAKVQTELGQDPAYLKAVKSITLAKEGSSERAAAAASVASAALSTFKLSEAKELGGAKTALAEATASGDATAIESARKRIDALDYNNNAEKAEKSAMASVLKERAATVQKFEAMAADPMKSDVERASIKKDLQEAQASYKALSNEFDKRIGVSSSATPETKPPLDGTRGVKGGVPGIVQNGVFVPDKQPVKETEMAAPGPEAPRSLIGSPAPSYKNWLSAKDKKDEIENAASKMSKDKREAYLTSRLPQIDAEIEFNKNYKTY